MTSLFRRRRLIVESSTLMRRALSSTSSSSSVRTPTIHILRSNEEAEEEVQTSSIPDPTPPPAVDETGGSNAWTRIIDMASPFSHGPPHQQEMVKVAVIQNAKCCSYWSSQLAFAVKKEAGARGGVVGLDLEWKPTFNAGETPSRAAVLQLSGPRLCLIIQLQQLQHIPRSLRGLLMDNDLVKVGVSVEYDLAKLRKDWGLASNNYHDVGRAGGRIFFEHDPFRVVSVHNLADSLWGVSLPKSDSVRLSNWERRQLTSRQVEYAALDAMASREIYLEFHRRGLLDMGRLEAQMGRWLLSADTEDRKRARGLAFECDSLRKLYKMHKRGSGRASGKPPV